MSKILILKGDKPNEHSLPYWMSYELNKIGLDKYETREYSDLVFDMQSNSARVWFHSDDTDLSDYDLVYMRDPKFYHFEQNACAIYLKSKNTKILNSEATKSSRANKLAQYMQFSLSDISIPKTLFCNNSLIVEQFKDQGFNFPVILKSISGRSGEDNFLITNQTELDEKVAEERGVKYLIQEFVPNNCDYRIVVFKGEVMCGYKRERLNNDTHLNGISQGGCRTLIDVSHQMSELAIIATKQLDRDICGVDIISDKNTNKLYVLEANLNFAMSYFNDGVESTFYNAFSKKIHNLTK